MTCTIILAAAFGACVAFAITEARKVLADGKRLRERLAQLEKQLQPEDWPEK